MKTEILQSSAVIVSIAYQNNVSLGNSFSVSVYYAEKFFQYWLRSHRKVDSQRDEELWMLASPSLAVLPAGAIQ